MMTLLLMYAYTRGVTSSREIERRCETDIAFRYLVDEGFQVGRGAIRTAFERRK